jgi:hypothetical protein
MNLMVTALQRYSVKAVHLQVVGMFDRLNDVPLSRFKDVTIQRCNAETQQRSNVQTMSQP